MLFFKVPAAAARAAGVAERVQHLVLARGQCHGADARDSPRGRKQEGQFQDMLHKMKLHMCT